MTASHDGVWPGGKRAALTLDIDDVHPEGRADPDRLDFGGDRDDGVFGFLTRLREQWPQLAITLFVTPDWIGRRDFPTGIFQPLRRVIGRRRPYLPGIFKLDDPRHAEWLAWFRDKVRMDGYEVAVHGLHHFSATARYSSTEFAGLPYSACQYRLEQAEVIFQAAGLGKPVGFRPPGWGWSDDLLRALRDRGYRYVALSSNFQTPLPKRFYAPESEASSPVLGPAYEPTYSLVNISANCLPSQFARACSIVERGGHLVIHAHIARTLPRLEHVGSHYIHRVERILIKLSQQYPGEIWFATHAQVGQYIAERLGVPH